MDTVWYTPHMHINGTSLEFQNFLSIFGFKHGLSCSLSPKHRPISGPVSESDLLAEPDQPVTLRCQSSLHAWARESGTLAQVRVYVTKNN